MLWIGPILLTLLGTALVSIALTYTEVERVMANWQTRRCEIPVMFTSYMYKPSYDSRSRTDFARDNFQFCLGKIATEVGKVGFAPFYAILGQQFSVMNQTAPVMNNMRGMLAERWKRLSKLFDEKYKKMGHIMVEFSRVYQKFRFSMGRANALALSFFYVGLSLNTFIGNFLKTSIRVTLIVAGILAALCIIMFFSLSPYISVIILPAITMALDAAAQANLDVDKPDTGPFCCDPEALVQMADGSWKSLQSVQIGDRLFSKTGENRVEGILSVDAKDISLVSIHGVKMSGSHRVFYKDWILAKDHPEAKPAESLERLICLNTTLHEVPMDGIIVGDWEEVSSEEGERAWIDFVANSLGTNVSNYPTNVPLASTTNGFVFQKEKGWIPLNSVKIGDWIQSGDTYTRVRGIYSGIGQFENLSDGVWIYENGWELLQKEKENEEREGLFFITENETFDIKIQETVYHVRDFTEVGASSIHRSYNFLSNYMKKGSQC